MDYQIIQREAFTAIGKRIAVSHTNDENLRTIPSFWDACEDDGTVERLRALRPDRMLLGICLENNPQTDLFEYAIAVEADFDSSASNQHWDTIDIPAATWAKFTAVGALPGAIHSLWARIFEEWFPATAYEHTGGPELEICPPGDALSDEYRCEVWIPVVQRV